MQAWKLEDWLKHHGIKGQKWGERRGPPYPLTAEAKSYKDKPPIDEVLAKSRTRSTIVQDAIRSGEVSKAINREKQLRHTLTKHPEGRSYIHGDLEFAQQLVDELSGTGEPIMTTGERWTHQERVESSQTVGTHIDSETGIETQTKKAVITYSKTGSHIYIPERTNNLWNLNIFLERMFALWMMRAWSMRALHGTMYTPMIMNRKESRESSSTTWFEQTGTSMRIRFSSAPQKSNQSK